MIKKQTLLIITEEDFIEIRDESFPGLTDEQINTAMENFDRSGNTVTDLRSDVFDALNYVKKEKHDDN